MKKDLRNNKDRLSFDEILADFLCLYEKEKLDFEPREVQVINYWFEKDLKEWQLRRFKDGADLMGVIASTAFFFTFYHKGMRSEDMEYIISKTSPALLKYIKHLDICPIGGDFFGSVQWDTLPNNISKLTGLTHMVLGGTNISNLEPLRGMNLHFLDISESKNIKNIEPLIDLPLSSIRLMGTGVSSLKVIENSKMLSTIWAQKTLVEKNSIETLESLEYLKEASISATKIKSFPERINRALHVDNKGLYNAHKDLVNPLHTEIDKNFWFSAYF